MSTIERRTVSLPAEQAAFIDTQVAAGVYASTSEVVRAGLRALRARDEAVERWLRDEVVPAYDEMIADPTSGIPLDLVFDELRARHAARLQERT